MNLELDPETPTDYTSWYSAHPGQWYALFHPVVQDMALRLFLDILENHPLLEDLRTKFVSSFWKPLQLTCKSPVKIDPLTVTTTEREAILRTLDCLIRDLEFGETSLQYAFKFTGIDPLVSEIPQDRLEQIFRDMRDMASRCVNLGLCNDNVHLYSNDWSKRYE